MVKPKLWFIVGASGSGKSACMPELKKKLQDYWVVDFDDIGVPENADTAWRQEATQLWLQQYLEQDKPMVILGGIVPGEVISCPSFDKLSDAIGLCFLDCAAYVRVDRLKARGDQQVGQSILNWASWLSMHLNDPQWEQHVIKDNAWRGMNFSMLEKITAWESCFSVISTIDTTNLTISDVCEELSSTILIGCTDGPHIVYKKELENQHRAQVFALLRKNAKDQLGLTFENNGPFSFVLLNNQYQAQAYIEGYCYYGCCYVDLLAVESHARGQGFGSQLLAKAEQLAKERQCLFVALSTMSFEARPFYEKHGYATEFIRDGFDKGAHMYFMKKQL